MAKKLLTKKRATWAEQRKDVVFVGKKLSYNASIASKYKQKLLRLVEKMTSEYNREIIKLFQSDSAEEHFTTDASIASQARILTNALADKFNALFARLAPDYAESMVNNSDKYSASSLHASLKDLSGGLSIKTSTLDKQTKSVLKASVAENVSLIKSISSEYLTKVQGSVMRSITSGNGLASLQPALEKYKGMTKRRAKNIALDQTRKVYNSLNKSRMQDIGLDEFIWEHSSGGQHPRKQHLEEFNGKTYSFDNLPIDDGLNEPVIPGQAPNCKCFMRPVLRLKPETDEPIDD